MAQPAARAGLRLARSATVRSPTGPPILRHRRDRGRHQTSLQIWIGTGGEGAKFWLQVLTEIKNRGTEDVCIVVCDGLKGLPESIEATWPLAAIQTRVLHLIRNTFRLASRRDWDKMAKDLRPVYTAPTEQAAKERLNEFHELWGERYPAIRGLWNNAWLVFAPFLDYSPEIRRVTTRPTRSSPCTRGCDGPPAPADTSPTTRPRSSASTWSCAASIRPGVVEGDG